MSREIIDHIQRRDRAAFGQWADSHDEHMPCLNMTPEAVRFFIPPELYVLADRQEFTLLKDPSALNTKINRVERDNLAFFIVEKRTEPVSNIADLMHFQYDVDDYRYRLLAGGDPNEPLPVVPPSVDEYHALFADDLLEEDGVLESDDFITHYIHLQTFDDQLHSEQNVVGYADRIRGERVGSGFYSRLDEIAERMRIRYVTGQNNPNNIRFFVDILGRVPLVELPGYRQRIISRHHGGIPDKRLFTVRLLDPRDQQRYGRRKPI